jgi:uncharacterized membrane protein YbhN (UPF0104 family)
MAAVPAAALAPHWMIVVNLMTSSLVGAHLGATWATKMATRTPYRVLAVLLLLIAVALLSTPIWATSNPPTSTVRRRPSPGCSPARRSAPSPRSRASPVASC